MDGRGRESGEIWVTGCRPIPGSTFRINRQGGRIVARYEGRKGGRKEGGKSAAEEPISRAANFWDEKDFSATRLSALQQSKSGKGTRERERERVLKSSTKARFLISLQNIESI